jgi:lipid A ethanolaminephosphotransferase
MAAAPDQLIRHTAAEGGASTSELPALTKSVRTGSSRRGWLSAPLAILAVSLFIAVFDNESLWGAAARATTLDEHRAAILWCLFAIVFCTTAAALSLALGARLLKIAGAALLLIAAICGFFMSEYGVVVDESMVRNIAETAVREATPLLGAAFFWHVALFGVVPAAALAVVPLRTPSWPQALLSRLAVAAAASATLLGTLYVNYAAFSFFGHQHHELRLLMNPGYALYAATRFALGDERQPPVARKALDARLGARLFDSSKPVLVVLVMGETARADRFSLNGYARDTNRYTRPLGVVNFGDVTSCGTSTADSVPCVFSPLGRDSFTHAAAATRESLFGTLARLGVEAFWRDNSTGCKDVCDDAHFEELATRSDAEFCDASGCFDEILLKDFDALLADRSRDHFVVLHQRGSHGPAYHTDAPAWIKEFAPECDLPNLRNCSRDAINNAYDNTILYTDYFLSRVIALLEARSAAFDTAMLYVSDHGESLGENGLYLHGFPYALAPPEQTRVPMLFWASKEFYANRARAEPECLRQTARRSTTHDAVFHTLLPLFRVHSPAYDASLDVFAECRQAAGAKVTRAAPKPPARG